MYVPKPRIRPFSNGSEWADWVAGNCDRCTRSRLEDGGTSCLLYVELVAAYVGDGTVSQYVGEAIGRGCVPMERCGHRELLPVWRAWADVVERPEMRLLFSARARVRGTRMWVRSWWRGLRSMPGCAWSWAHTESLRHTSSGAVGTGENLGWRRGLGIAWGIRRPYRSWRQCVAEALCQVRGEWMAAWAAREHHGDTETLRTNETNGEVGHE